MKNIFITGGGGYVGVPLVDHLLKKGFKVTVLDLFLYGEDVLSEHKNLTKIKGDIRDVNILKKYLKNQEIVIHLACISNDPSFELNPTLGKSINLDAFEPLVKISRENNVRKFIYASSSSVYGIKEEKNVVEDMKLVPLTDYSKFKAQCEKILFKYKSDNFITTVVRPATVCGFSKRQRLDLVVNILSNLAYHKKEITVFGGSQLRPNININDMVGFYDLLINSDEKKINGEIFNAGFQNYTVNQLAISVKKIVGDDIKIITKPTDDNRSYHISSQKIFDVLNFVPKFTIEDAISDLVNAFDNNRLIDPLNNKNYYNIKLMNSINLK
jgi:nucleoside-diphosphate-sugar epimerase